MNVQDRDKIVLLGFLSHFPVAGVAWQTLHYLIGFQRLGYEVYYVEAHGCTASKLMQSETDDGPARAAAYISDLMRRFDLGDRWCYHALHESRYFGLSETQLKDLYRDAALIINLHGSHLPSPELTATNRLVYLGTDPVDIEVDIHNQKQEAIDYLRPHCAFFTYGENLGRPDCLVPIRNRSSFFHPPARGYGMLGIPLRWRRRGVHHYWQLAAAVARSAVERPEIPLEQTPRVPQGH